MENMVQKKIMLKNTENLLVLIIVSLPIVIPIFSLVIFRKYQNITLLVYYGYVLSFILNLYLFYNLLKYEYMKYKIVIFLQESIEKKISNKSICRSSKFIRYFSYFCYFNWLNELFL